MKILPDYTFGGLRSQCQKCKQSGACTLTHCTPVTAASNFNIQGVDDIDINRLPPISVLESILKLLKSEDTNKGPLNQNKHRAVKWSCLGERTFRQIDILTLIGLNKQLISKQLQLRKEIEMYNNSEKEGLPPGIFNLKFSAGTKIFYDLLFKKEICEIKVDSNVGQITNKEALMAGLTVRETEVLTSCMLEDISTVNSELSLPMASYLVNVIQNCDPHNLHILVDYTKNSTKKLQAHATELTELCHFSIYSQVPRPLGATPLLNFFP